MSLHINTAIYKLSRRAENTERSHLVSTFVDVGPLFTLFSSVDHQILYGRRGTGKTHALYYLANSIEADGDISIQLDMRTIGSTGGICADPSIPLAERATRLLVDTLTFIHESLLNYVIDKDEEFNLSALGPLLDSFADAITEVRVVGSVENEETLGQRNQIQDSTNLGVLLSPTNMNTNFGIQQTQQRENDIQQRFRRSGVERHRVHFGSVQNVLSQIISQLNNKRIWLLLDEWSEVPLDIQPYLADFIRRSIFPIAGFTVKITAIEQRCQFRIMSETGGYIGIELGAEIASSLSLDEFMVFDNDAQRALDFFGELIYKHVKPKIDATKGPVPATKADFIREVFTQISAFEEFVRAAEGVPRDAINILIHAAQRANTNKISVQDIRLAAKTWYNRAKEGSLHAKPIAHELLRWIIDEVIGHRQARAFLLRSNVKDDLIDFLFDARVLHVVKQSVSGRDEPGVRYNVYSIDYGCYVDLINTTRAPQGLFDVDTEQGAEFVQVPVSDYRAIRRAILNIDKFYQSTNPTRLF